ncbi:response regulator transcription factor [Companilactobacillus sp.]|jgi:two-component system response regulator CiaR|uniref:response regulator transcription factor n=1 Tax=Companilactobacillus sp. TaxID=2767905 RepID=UPI0025B9F83F|nr:response regulator transcription factor [Companilactobacillus sp.]MCH4007944.1 response regulator transcription factor [Companilactobacillus sp.]MCH4051877.1 response regulator transcription factor [Companilactobacillus sp.]MCH4075887.1 response regulator transcription factor [Companilactobacillus sp.]MCH4124462.1 response regulator transcription factor [Companilactobacillus sp.]MCH4132575.1 response regulator transcription factor [Companilactobacillus sp.]
MDNNIKILVVEDDVDLANNVESFLSDFAQVDIENDGLSGKFDAVEGVYDLIILDLMLPGMNGYDILKDIRKEKITTPVLILTAKAELDDKLRGFDLGADDYLTKPFHREELQVRVRALLKRSGALADDSILKINDIEINLNNHEVMIENQPISLNGKEYDLLVYLVQNKNTILTKDQIFERIWGFDSDTSITVVEVYMSNLRKKLRASNNDYLIKTIRNVGYIFQNEEKAKN